MGSDQNLGKWPYGSKDWTWNVEGKLEVKDHSKASGLSMPAMERQRPWQDGVGSSHSCGSIWGQLNL